MRFRKTPQGDREGVEDFTGAVLDALIEQPLTASSTNPFMGRATTTLPGLLRRVLASLPGTLLSRRFARGHGRACRIDIGFEDKPDS